jgi:hypothetical protein
MWIGCSMSDSAPPRLGPIRGMRTESTTRAVCRSSAPFTWNVTNPPKPRIVRFATS